MKKKPRNIISEYASSIPRLEARSVMLGQQKPKSKRCCIFFLILLITYYFCPQNTLNQI